MGFEIVVSKHFFIKQNVCFIALTIIIKVIDSQRTLLECRRCYVYIMFF